MLRNLFPLSPFVCSALIAWTGCSDTLVLEQPTPTDTSITSEDPTATDADASPHTDTPPEHDAPPADTAPFDTSISEDTTPMDIPTPEDTAIEEDTALSADTDPPEDTALPNTPTTEHYPTTRTHSPITPSIAERLKAIAAQHPGRNDHVFAKIGDSITVSPHFLTCFAGSQVDLGAYDTLTPTWEHFLGGWADGTTPYERSSLAATGGWPAFRALDGEPTPLEQEIAAIDPRFAVIMFGTNDIGWDNIDRYAGNMLTITDTLIEHGVVPLLMTIPPRDDDRVDGALEVPRTNAIIRAIAQVREVPLIDYHREMSMLPSNGLGTDRVHPSVYREAGARACVFTPEGLRYGYNTRNLVTLAGLHRVQRTIIDDAAAPDAPSTPISAGRGTPEQPFIIDQLPFSDQRDTRTSPHRTIDTYTGCNATQDESGPEWFYQLDLDRRTTIRAMVVDRDDVDIDLHLLDGSTAETCVARAHTAFTATLGPGRATFVLDTFVSGSEERSGEYIFVVFEEEGE